MRRGVCCADPSSNTQPDTCLRLVGVANTVTPWTRGCEVAIVGVLSGAGDQSHLPSRPKTDDHRHTQRRSFTEIVGCDDQSLAGEIRIDEQS